MSPALQTVAEVWNRRSTHRHRSAYDSYVAVLLVLAVGTPAARGVWATATSPESLEALRSTAAPLFAGLAAAGLWAAMLVLGAVRGPAIRPAPLTAILAGAPMPRAIAFGRPTLAAGLAVAAGVTGVGSMVAGAMWSAEYASLREAGTFAMASAGVGSVAAVAWLAGQAFPRTAHTLATWLVIVAVASSFTSSLAAVTPWGWVALAYPATAEPGSGALAAGVALVALGIAATTLSPVMMAKLHTSVLVTHASRWDSTTANIVGMEMNLAAARYRTHPRHGRAWRAALPAAPRPVTFMARDAIGAARTPARLALAVVSLATATLMLGFAMSAAALPWLWGAVAGLLAFAGLGPLTDGLRHAAEATAGSTLYGIPDATLVGFHGVFPLLASAAVVAVVVILANSGALGTGMAAVVVTALLARLTTALRGALPPSLMTPVLTPLGDLSALARAVWSVDGIVLAGFAGVAAAYLVVAPALLAAIPLIALALLASRWRHRR